MNEAGVDDRESEGEMIDSGESMTLAVIRQLNQPVHPWLSGPGMCPPQGHSRRPKLGSEGTEKLSIRMVRGSCSEEPSWILQAHSVSQPRNWLWASDDSNKLTAKKENKNGLSQGTGNGTTAGQGGGRASASWGFGHRTRARSGDQHTS